jgi:hypothetical protein
MRRMTVLVALIGTLVGVAVSIVYWWATNLDITIYPGPFPPVDVESIGHVVGRPEPRNFAAVSIASGAVLGTIIGLIISRFGWRISKSGNR